MWTRLPPDSALVVVDMQNDFAHPWGSLRVRGAEDLLPILALVITEAQRAHIPVIYTKDWHPESTPHFKTSGGPWPSHCVADTWGAQLVGGLPRAIPCIEVHKGTGQSDGYSGFIVIEPNGQKRETGLATLLRDLAVKSVLIGGLATDYCVKHTALDAVRLGFAATVALDAIRSVEQHPGDGDRALDEMATSGVEVMELSGVLGGGEHWAR